MVDTETSQSGNGFSLQQILQTDWTLATVFTENISCRQAQTQQP